ncbi:MAG: DUF2283 domain-containing protein [Candidatus Nanoarchaeia archaeon]
MVLGQNNKFRWDYNEKSDILNIHELKKKTSGSAELGDFTVDFDSKDNVIGIEILYASEFLENMGISKEQLENLQDAEIIISKKGNRTLIFTVITIQNTKHTIPIPAPVMVETAA